MHTSAGASPAAAGDASNPGGWTGTSRDVASLRQWLDANGVDANAFGVNGAKSLTDLAIEVERGETTLALDDVTNAPRRDVRVLRLLVTDETWPGQVLVEARQEWESGRVRYRNTPLSEKLLGNEDWRDAVTTRGGRGARRRDRRDSVFVEGRRKQREADRGGQGIIIVPWVVFEVSVCFYLRMGN